MQSNIKPESFLKNGNVLIGKDSYAIIKAKRPTPHAFANIIDQKEITVIIKQDLLDPDNCLAIEKDWKLITFDMVLPFELVGFLAIISQALADEGISIFALSAYSTDHILVRQKDLSETEKALRQLGCNIIYH